MHARFVVAFLAAALFSMGTAAQVQLDRIKLPPGFSIELFARVDNARQMALGRSDANGGIVFVGSMRAGKVHAVRFDAAYKASAVTTVASGLQLPVGVAYRDGALYVSAVSRILRYDNIEQRLEQPPAPVVVTDRLPTETHHGWKFIAFGPDGKLYVPVGAPCNICEPDPQRYANILRMNPDGSNVETFARGVRNTVGFDWQPHSGELWFTDNGRDMLGDGLPPDELNHAPRAGMHFGYPYCHGGDLPDPEFGAKRGCADFTAPAQKLGPHVASLGMRFYTGAMFPPAYRNQVFIAEHGSWNRHKYTGGRIVRVVADANGKNAKQEVFASGWINGDQSYTGRPADILLAPDGSILVADDWAGAIYRISYAK